MRMQSSSSEQAKCKISRLDYYCTCRYGNRPRELAHFLVRETNLAVGFQHPKIGVQTQEANRKQAAVTQHHSNLNERPQNQSKSKSESRTKEPRATTKNETQSKIMSLVRST
jgi:hypothetical protein